MWLPLSVAQVGAWRQTPWVATWAIGLPSAGIAMFTDFADLADMISIGTFLVFMIVAFGLLWLRWCADSTAKGAVGRAHSIL
jgi:APA family basic amino acid/polyamine antiporter